MTKRTSSSVRDMCHVRGGIPSLAALTSASTPDGIMASLDSLSDEPHIPGDRS